jgi:hypothetical protein
VIDRSHISSLGTQSADCTQARSSVNSQNAIVTIVVSTPTTACLTGAARKSYWGKLSTIVRSPASYTVAITSFQSLTQSYQAKLTTRISSSAALTQTLARVSFVTDEYLWTSANDYSLHAAWVIYPLPPFQNATGGSVSILSAATTATTAYSLCGTTSLAGAFPLRITGQHLLQPVKLL